MSTTLILVVTACYAGIAVSEAWKRNWGMSVVFLGYVLANLGLLASMRPPA